MSDKSNELFGGETMSDEEFVQENLHFQAVYWTKVTKFVKATKILSDE